MKKSLILSILIVLMMIPTVLSAEAAKDNSAVWTSRYNPGSLMATVGVGYAGFGLGVAGGVEAFVYQMKIADVIPLDFSVMGRAGVDAFGFLGGLDFGFGGLAVVHFSFAGLKDAPWFLSKTDVYAGLGLGFSIISYYYDWGGLGLADVEGANYYLNDNLAINAEYTMLGAHYWTGSVGITLKI